MKVIILGGSGFLGSNIAKAAKSKHLRVNALARNPKTADQIKANACDPSTYSNLLTENTHMIHSIGVLWNGMGGQTFTQANLESAITPASQLAVSRAGKRPCFVYISAANSPPPPFPAGKVFG